MNRTLGMGEAQFDDLLDLVRQAVPEKVNRLGRRRKLSLASKVRITVLYLRTNNTQEFLAAMFGVSQSVASRAITAMTETLAWLLETFVPDPEAATRGTTLLLDGTLAPCWSWADTPDLYSGKHKTTGHNIQVVSDLRGRLVYLSPPLPGNTHDTAAFREHDLPSLLTSIRTGNTVADKGYQGCGIITPRKKLRGRERTDHDKAANKPIHQMRAAIERVIANIKTWRVLHTDYRRPRNTFTDTLNAVRGLIFFVRNAGHYE